MIKEAIVNLDNSSNSEKIKPVKLEEKDIIADLHIHSRFSRATSKNLSIDNLAKWARIKGINLLGTGDISHEEWLAEIKTKLVENKETGILWYEFEDKTKFPFILTGEISLVFTSLGKGRRVHLVYLVPSLETNSKINKYLDSLGRRDYDGRPIFSVSCEEFTRVLKEIDSRIEIIPAHVWTPWFGVFGSESGFNSLKDAFASQFGNIHAIETGMSSDPEMNWKLKELGDKAIISFSDSHSFWPWRLGREATIFKSDGLENFSYNELIKQIREKTFKSTIETEPGYGKYHFDGHRNCGFSCAPAKTRELKGICPVCSKPLVIGVENRVEELANNTGIPNNARAFFKILPLHELIAFFIKSKVENKKTWEIYNKLIEKFGNEFNILLKVDKNVLASELAKDKLEKLADLIIDNRIANLKVKPGFDGEYGVLVEKNSENQKTLI
ncbi:DNA helicase UvrD [Candidatus Pacearchaeota archaeon]|nr:DNA helicase UvrD [Candidatus Pacearchaeota archaeon]